MSVLCAKFADLDTIPEQLAYSVFPLNGGPAILAIRVIRQGAAYLKKCIAVDRLLTLYLVELAHNHFAEVVHGNPRPR